MSQRLKEIIKFEFPHLHIVSLIRVQKEMQPFKNSCAYKKKIKIKKAHLLPDTVRDKLTD